MEHCSSINSSGKSSSCHSCSKEKGRATASSPSPSAGYGAVAIATAGNSHGGASADEATPVMLCACLRPATSFVANTASNPNRVFFKCGNPARQVVRCNCFRGIQGCFLWVWEDLLKQYVNIAVSLRTRRLEDLVEAFEEREAASGMEVAKMERDLTEAARKIAAHERAVEEYVRILKAAKATIRAQKFIIAILLLCILVRIAS